MKWLRSSVVWWRTKKIDSGDQSQRNNIFQLPAKLERHKSYISLIWNILTLQSHFIFSLSQKSQRLMMKTFTYFTIFPSYFTIGTNNSTMFTCKKPILCHGGYGLNACNSLHVIHHFLECERHKEFNFFVFCK